MVGELAYAMRRLRGRSAVGCDQDRGHPEMRMPDCAFLQKVKTVLLANSEGGKGDPFRDDGFPFGNLCDDWRIFPSSR